MPRVLVILAVGGLLLVGVVRPSRADDDLAPLLEQLFTSDIAPALEAGDRLRALGARAREALERRVDPQGAVDRASPLSTDEAEEIDELIEQLADGRFATRERASSELLKKGLPALGRLRAAVGDGDAERRLRAQRVIDTLLPPRSITGPLGTFPRVQAVLMLGWIGERGSIPALRRALDDPAPEVAAAADGALRLVLSGGPAGMPLEWQGQANELRAKWDQYIANTVAPTPGEVECRFAPLASQGGRHVLALGRHEWRIDSQAMGMPGAKRNMVWRESCEEIYRPTSLSGAPVKLERQYVTHRTVRTLEGAPEGAGGRPHDGVELSGKSLTFTLGEDGKLECADDVWKRERGRPLIVPAELLMAGLPSGALQVGASVTLPEDLVRRIGCLLKLADTALENPRVAQGQMRYLGRDDGVDRVFVALEWVGQIQGNPPCEILLQGTLEIDAASGLLLAHDLCGPMWVVENHRGGLVMLGEQRFEAVICGSALPPTGTPTLDRALAALLDANLSTRIAAARELRAAGESIRPILERILRPEAGDAEAAAAVATRIDAYLAASDTAIRQRALVGLLTRVGPARHALLERLRTADAATADTLRALDVRLWPFESVATEAALLLAAVGTVDSVPALRSALRAGSPGTAAAADHALRAIVGEGPASAPGDPLHMERAALLAGWEARLGAGTDAEVAARLTTWSGAATVVPALHAPDAELAARLQCQLAVRLSSQRAEGLVAGDTVVTSTADSRFRRIAGASLRVEGRLVSYRDRIETAATPKPKPVEIDDADAVIAQDRPDALALTIGGKRIQASAPAVLPIAMLWADLLPAGEYAVGATRSLTPELVDRLRMALAIPPSYAGVVSEASGRLRYLGRVDGRDRFAFALVSAVEVPKHHIVDRSALAGVIAIDPARALVVQVRLAGPGWGQIGDSTALGWTAITEDELAPPAK